MEKWETLIGAKMRPAQKICRIEDPVKRNAAAATKRWRKKNWKHYQEKQKEWREANPEKIKVYQERNKKNIKRWAKEHPERIRELNRKNDRKRAKSPKRIAWTKEYNQRPEVIERRREWDLARNRTPERRAYDRERKKRQREAKKAAKEAA